MTSRFPASSSQSTATESRPIGWASGTISDVFFAARIPAGRATASASPFDSVPLASASNAFSFIRTRPVAVARRRVVALAPTSIIRARPRASTCRTLRKSGATDRGRRGRFGRLGSSSLNSGSLPGGYVLFQSVEILEGVAGGIESAPFRFLENFRPRLLRQLLEGKLLAGDPLESEGKDSAPPDRGERLQAAPGARKKNRGRRLQAAAGDLGDQRGGEHGRVDRDHEEMILDLFERARQAEDRPLAWGRVEQDTHASQSRVG